MRQLGGKEIGKKGGRRRLLEGSIAGTIYYQEIIWMVRQRV